MSTVAQYVIAFGVSLSGCALWGWGCGAWMAGDDRGKRQAAVGMASMLGAIVLGVVWGL